MLYLQDLAWSKLLFFCSIKKHFLIVIRGSSYVYFYLGNDKSSTRLVCYDSNYLDIYLINVQLCVKSQVGWHPERPA